MHENLTLENLSHVLDACFQDYIKTVGAFPTHLYISWKAFFLAMKVKDPKFVITPTDVSYCGVPVSINATILENLIYFTGDE